jgi:pimeloyl-ACP methyl ester carboxylesterase
MNETLIIDGARLRYRQAKSDCSSGDPLIFQHGMGGDLTQPMKYVGENPAGRVISLNARGHGDSDPISNLAQATFDTYADDVIALANHLDIDRFVIGGISLGAGTAINLTVRYPERVSGLILCRPAWADHPQTDFIRDTFAYLATLLRGAPVDEALATFIASPTYRHVLAQSPSAAESLVGQLTRTGAVENLMILNRFPSSSPTTDRRQWKHVTVPTLVIGHRDDPFHAYDIAQLYAEIIPSAQLATVPSKDRDTTGFFAQITNAINDYLANRTQR